MKITIAYIADCPDEVRKARIIERFARGLFGGVKVRESDRHPPFKHIYLATKKPAIPTDTRDSS